MQRCHECLKNEGNRQFSDDKKYWYCDNCYVKTKECRGCHKVLSISKFERNNRAPKSQMMQRRSECYPCRKARVGVSIKGKTKWQKKNPKPPTGDTFECPICKRMFTVNKTNVHLDHDSTTGEIRGYVCADCNTGMGKMRDDISVMARAILWLRQNLNSWLF